MSGSPYPMSLPSHPHWRDVLELFKPVTWFPPMWAFMCGVVSTGAAGWQHWPYIFGGV
ncbi:MAG: bacteriochlorophyll/chlorophyll synthetase, partial [Pseudomonadota bacterium]